MRCIRIFCVASQLQRSHAGHEKTIDFALDKFNQYADKGAEIHPDLRQAIFIISGKHGSNETSQKLRTTFEKSGFPEVERNSIVGMGSSKDEKTLREVFDYAIKDEKIRPQDLHSLFAGPLSNKVGQDFVWQYFKDNCDLVLKRLGGSPNSNIFQHIIKLCIISHAETSKAEEYGQFIKSKFDEYSQKILDRPTRQAAETVRINAYLLKVNEAKLAEFLVHEGY